MHRTFVPPPFTLLRSPSSVFVLSYSSSANHIGAYFQPVDPAHKYGASGVHTYGKIEVFPFSTSGGPRVSAIRRSPLWLHWSDEKFIAFQFQYASFPDGRDGYGLPRSRKRAGWRDEIVQRHGCRIIEHVRNLAGEWRNRRQRNRRND